ncbi:uncharacterized protein EAE98_003771 [Botrytis deweyae]|uniref:Heterokaryon incompatibility domain-containing protein n=1 Tax=Botrytis deweyae TaxID=2478750 RepID=A0ABQ7IRN2_9HELO|nr:uncharacterized protein EAE98_003771 [Botrytis deweyae]KAF7932472.1 hypothetical protein EAE98_003771 [Botrytis deweyae]
MSQSLYSSLSLESNKIRLLRILPNENEEAEINCTLFVYPLHDSGRGTHRYEALSYVWGDADNSRSICVNGHRLKVRANLHIALSRLRDTILDRIIWIDAICINQEDLNERGHQVQLMAKIYSKASQVVIWLGEAADNSDRALEEIVVAASQSEISSNKVARKAILALLQRPWFRRIWVLQEVAAARHILIMCGLVEIDGNAFCAGLNTSKAYLKAYPRLQRLIRSVIYLIKEATLRPKYATSSSDNFSLDIRPLSELIDTYHTRESTDDLDKVYALLAMCSDNPTSAGLLPDYTILWEQLIQQLVHFILCKEIEVKVLQDRNKAIFRSKGCVIASVISVEFDVVWNDTQTVHIKFTDTFEYLSWDKQMETRATFNIPTTEKNIQRGDILCILQGVSKPTIIRLCDDHFSVIMIAATPSGFESGSKSEWDDVLRSITTYPRDLLLAWDLGGSWKKLGSLESENLRVPVNSNSMLEENLKTDEIRGAEKDMEPREEIRDSLEVKIHTKAEGCSEPEWSSEAKENSDSEEYMTAEEYPTVEEHPTVEEYPTVEECLSMSENLEVGEHLNLDGYSETGSRTWDNLIRMRNVALILKDLGLYADAEELFLQLIRTRKQLQGVEHPQTLSSIADLQLYYRERELLEGTEEIEAMKHLLDTAESAVRVLKEEVVKIASLPSCKAMVLLFERRGGQVPITEKVVKAAAANKDCGIDMMKLLFKERNDLSITEEVIRIAAGNVDEGFHIVRFLFQKRGDQVPITEDIVEKAARKVRQEEVLKAAIRNEEEGPDIMQYFFERRGSQILITEEILKILVGTKWRGCDAKQLFFERLGDQIPITEELLKVIAGSQLFAARSLMSNLFERLEDHFPITEETLQEILELAAKKWEPDFVKRFST